MAVLKIFTVYDSKADAYMQPFFMRSHGEAVRSWIDAVNDPNTAFNKHPEDFTLFEIGEFDDGSALFTPAVAKRSIGTAVEFKRQQKEVH